MLAQKDIVSIRAKATATESSDKKAWKIRRFTVEILFSKTITLPS
jgi:hypothetical protein